MKKKKVLNTILLIVAMLAAGVSGWKLYDIWHGYKVSRELYSGLQDAYTETTPSTESNLEEEIDTETDEESNKVPIEPPITVDWDGLKEINDDIVGWIYVEALPQISFPIVQGTDDSYYVHLTYDKQPSKAGCIFMSFLCNSDFSSPVSLIYGHNMQDGSMFSPLFTNRADGTFDKNPYIWIVTPNESHLYEVCSIFETGRSSNAFRVFEEFNYLYDEYILDMVGRNQFLAEPSYVDSEQPVIVLSSCVPDTYNRTLYFAKRIDTITEE